jgi:hypothetical protein
MADPLTAFLGAGLLVAITHQNTSLLQAQTGTAQATQARKVARFSPALAKYQRLGWS